MKLEIEQLIDRLADNLFTKGLKFRWQNADGSGEWYEDEIIRVDQYGLIDSDKENNWTDDEMTERIKQGKLILLGHPILIGDVLAYMWKNWKGTYNDQVLPLVDAWGKVGLEKSLQEIFAECEWVQVFRSSKNCGIEREGDGECDCGQWFPQQKAHRELFEFLLQLGL